MMVKIKTITTRYDRFKMNMDMVGMNMDSGYGKPMLKAAIERR